LSIANFQEKFIKGGCGVAILIGIAAAMLASMFYMSCGAPPTGATGQGKSESAVAFTVGGTPVPADIVEAGIQDQVRGMQAQFGGMTDMLPPTFQAKTVGGVVRTLIDAAAYLPLAKKLGVDLSDEALVKAAEAEFDQLVERERMNMIQRGALKPDASRADFDRLVKQQAGKTIDELRKDRLENLRTSLADPSRRQSALISLAQPAVLQALAAKKSPSDDEVKKSFETITYKRILFQDGLPGKTAQERAEAALKELKGGAKFETVMDRASNDIAPQGQKLSTQPPTTTNASAVANDPALSPLGSLQPGQNSEIVDVPSGKAIYHVVSRDPNVPKDYEKEKARYRKDYIQSQVQADAQKQLEEIKKSADFIQWNAPGYQAIYRYDTLTGPSPFGGADLTDPKQMREVYDAAKAALAKSPGFDRQAAALAAYAAMDSLYNAGGANKAELRDERISSILAMLETTESFPLRMNLVDLYLEADKPDEAFNQLRMAVEYNTSYDQVGQQRYTTAFDKLTQLRAQNKIKPEEAKPIVAELDRWKAEKAKADKEAAEAQKRAEEEAKKAAEEAKKTADAEKSKPATPAPKTGN
jgi:hypothetical protein